MALISLLVEEVNPEELMKQQGGADSQIRRELEVKIGELFILIFDGQVVVDEDLELYHAACGCLW